MVVQSVLRHFLRTIFCPRRPSKEPGKSCVKWLHNASVDFAYSSLYKIFSRCAAFRTWLLYLPQRSLPLALTKFPLQKLSCSTLWVSQGQHKCRCYSRLLELSGKSEGRYTAVLRQAGNACEPGVSGGKRGGGREAHTSAGRNPSGPIQTCGAAVCSLAPFLQRGRPLPLPSSVCTRLPSHPRAPPPTLPFTPPHSSHLLASSFPPPVLLLPSPPRLAQPATSLPR